MKPGKASAKEKVQIAVMGSYETDGKLSISSLNNNINLIEGLDKIASNLPIENLPVTLLVDNYPVTIDNSGIVTISDEEIKVEPNFENFKNYKEIYSASVDDYSDFTGTYTLNKSYPLLIIAVSSIGDDASEESYTDINVSNTTQNLMKLVNNERHPYVSAQYYSSFSLAYLVNPKVGTTVKATASFRGSMHIYALGIDTENNN